MKLPTLEEINQTDVLPKPRAIERYRGDSDHRLRELRLSYYLTKANPATSAGQATFAPVSEDL